MEYLLIFILQLLGIGFHVMQKVIGFGNTYPDKSQNEIFAIFWKEDWDTLGVSALVLLLDLVAHLIVSEYGPEIKVMTFAVPYTEIAVNYLIASFLFAFFLGYAGQRVIYKWLGSTEKKISEKL